MEIDGKHYKAYTKGYVSKKQHEYEIAEIAVNMHVDQILDDDSDFRLDRIIRVNGQEFGLEHDRDTEDIPFIKKKMRNLADYPHDTLWVVPHELRRQAILEVAPNDKHWVALFKDAYTPHEEVWINKEGEVAALPRSEG